MRARARARVCVCVCVCVGYVLQRVGVGGWSASMCDSYSKQKVCDSLYTMTSVQNNRASRHHLVCTNVPLAEFMYLVFTRMPGESYRRRLRSLLCTCVTYFDR